MPELPEVETVVVLLRDLIINKEIRNVEVFWDNIIAHPHLGEFESKIKNQTFRSVNRRGKYIIFELTDYILISHLRMEGKYYVFDTPKDKSKHTHVIYNFKDGGQMHYHDTRKFGKMYLYSKSENLDAISDLGPEPWDPNLTGKSLKIKARKKTIPIKSFLLDQKIIAGIGNIYANEILFAARIHPETRTYKITIKEFEEIILSTQDILDRAIQDGGTTIRSYTSSLGVTGLFQQSLYVHNKEDELCRCCNSKIIKIMVNKRGTYLCPTCQIKK